ncbi:hypothetical protein EMN47_19555 [Prolixibacteraceae bacterium JC049]|nr:hypothetical protein [Prolixibacteraceae bacterium JC049]
MPTIHKLIVLILFKIIALGCFAQQNITTHSKVNLKYTIIDTVKVRPNSALLKVLWLNDTITLWKQNIEVKIDIGRYRKALKDSTALSNPKDIEELIKLRKMSGQNCYSYALEKYFENNTVYSQSIFGKRTSLSRETIETILDEYFEKVGEFRTKPKRNLNQPVADDVVLAFENKFKWIIHTVYHKEGVFYTKNGWNKPGKFKSLRKFLKKSYWDTERIIVYKIDSEKVSKD